MVAALLAKVGLPLLVNAVSGGLSKVDHPAAKAASAALGEVDKAIRGDEITPEQIAEANRHTERMKELDNEADIETLRAVNETMRVEAKSEDAYVRRWRPTFGYAVALTWTAVMLSIAWAVVVEPAQAPTIIAAMVNTSPIWGIALGVLGVSVVKRSHDKAVAADMPRSSGLFAGLVGKVKGTPK